MHVSGGGRRSLSNYAAPLRLRKPLWTDLVDRLLRVPGVGKIICWRYEDYEIKQEEILRRLSQGVRKDFTLDLPPLNVTPSRPTMRLIAEAIPNDSPKNRHREVEEIKRASFRKPGDVLPYELELDLKLSAARIYDHDINLLKSKPGVTML